MFNRLHGTRIPSGDANPPGEAGSDEAESSSRRRATSTSERSSPLQPRLTTNTQTDPSPRARLPGAAGETSGSSPSGSPQRRPTSSAEGPVLLRSGPAPSARPGPRAGVPPAPATRGEPIDPVALRAIDRAAEYRLPSLSLRGVSDPALLSTVVTRLPWLTDLSIQFVGIERADSSGAGLPDDLGRLRSLHHLRVDGLAAHTLPASLGELEHLQTLRVRFSELESLPEEAAGLRGLRTLDLSHNARLRSLPEDISGWRQLEEMTLTGTRELEHLPLQLGSLPRLQQIDLLGSGVRQLPSSMVDLPESFRVRLPAVLEAAWQGLMELRELLHEPHLAHVAQALAGVDESLRSPMRNWLLGMHRIYGLNDSDLDLAARALQAATARSGVQGALTQFLNEHVFQPVTAEGLPAPGEFVVTGSASDLYSAALAHRVMVEVDPAAAERSVREALNDPELSLQMEQVLGTRGGTMWPPMKAYVSMHDPIGVAASEAAEERLSLAFEQAQEGRITEAEYKQLADEAGKAVQTHIADRARNLFMIWTLQETIEQDPSGRGQLLGPQAADLLAGLMAMADSGPEQLLRQLQQELQQAGLDLSRLGTTDLGETLMHVLCDAIIEDSLGPARAADMIPALIALGIDINAPTNGGHTPLMRAMSSAQLAEALIAHGADVNARDHEGRTALFAAHGEGVVDLLVRHGADVAHIDHQGRSAIDFALRYFNLTVPMFRDLAAAGVPVSESSRQRLLADQPEAQRGDVPPAGASPQAWAAFFEQAARRLGRRGPRD